MAHVVCECGSRMACQRPFECITSRAICKIPFHHKCGLKWNFRLVAMTDDIDTVDDNVDVDEEDYL